MQFKDFVAFIAECKNWRGAKYLLAAIDQLFTYTIWRDTKAAILIFGRGTAHTSALKTIVEVIPQHPQYREFLGRTGETTFRYVFTHREDSNREITVTIAYYIVPTAKSNKKGP